MLILASLSGIQEYLFEVRETGGRQAKALRFRSLYIQLIAEAIGIRLLHAVGLSEDHLLFGSAGKLALDGLGLSQAQRDALDHEAEEIERWLLSETQGCLRLSMVCSNMTGRVSDMLFCQLAHVDSLREICNGLACCLGKLAHLGIKNAPNKSTLSYANYRCRLFIVHPLLAHN